MKTASLVPFRKFMRENLRSDRPIKRLRLAPSQAKKLVNCGRQVRPVIGELKTPDQRPISVLISCRALGVYLCPSRDVAEGRRPRLALLPTTRGTYFLFGTSRFRDNVAIAKKVAVSCSDNDSDRYPS